MIRSCVTVSLVPEARGGPFVFWDDLPAACRSVAELEFDAIEIFAPGPEAIDAAALRSLLAEHRLELAAMGTGAGWVRHRLHLTHGDSEIRSRASDFIRSIIDAAATFGAPAIIGSMQGRWGDGVTRDEALDHLAAALDELGQHARRQGTPLLYEPLNRYETNLINTIGDGCKLLERLATGNVRLLADLFHMNIEEVDLPAAIRRGGGKIGHVHFVDSNRRPAGCGHLDFAPIAAALGEIGYAGFVSAEALPYPDPLGAARFTIDAYRRYFQGPPSPASIVAF
jgi:sugar phosphate isomerase/epimerase